MKTNPSFERRITYTSIHDPILIQYTGEYDFEIPQKILPNPITMKKIQENIHLKPTDCYNKLSKEEDFINLKQIYNKKARTKKNEDSNCSEMPKEYAQIHQTVDDDEFVQEYSKKKGKSPCLILYNDDQIKDLASIIRSHDDLIIGVDRTFNLSFFYATTIVFKSPKVKNSRNNHPIFLGPIFLHKEATFDQYHYFFSHIKCAIQHEDFRKKDFEVNELPEVCFGSDQEKALTKAIESVFPESKKRHCYLHLKENISRKMIEDGIPLNYRTSITKMIFNDNGIICTEDPTLKEIKISQLETYSATFDGFSKYYTAYIKPILKTSYYDNINGQIWSNNDAESMNNVIKQETNRTIQTVPQLIKILKGIVGRQYLDLKASIYGSGNFKLTGIYTLYQLNYAKWRSLTEDKKMKCFTQLVEDSKKHGLNEEQVKRKFKGVATKPHQRKRAATERTKKKYC